MSFREIFCVYIDSLHGLFGSFDTAMILLINLCTNFEYVLNVPRKSLSFITMIFCIFYREYELLIVGYFLKYVNFSWFSVAVILVLVNFPLCCNWRIRFSQLIVCVSPKPYLVIFTTYWFHSYFLHPPGGVLAYATLVCMNGARWRHWYK